MNAPLTAERTVPTPSGPYLSHSRVSKYLHCPEQYRLHYVVGLRLRVADASLVFGKVIHAALEATFRSGNDPVAEFTAQWEALRDEQLTYKDRESWEILDVKGRALLAKFMREAFPRIGRIVAVEHAFTLSVTNLSEPLFGVIDLVAELDDTLTVIDYKTAASGYQPHEVVLSDQLTIYQLAVPEADQTALCVFVKTKEPRIDWHLASRDGSRLAEYLGKVQLVAEEITAGRFYKRPGKWCSYCDFLPVCMGDERKVSETLIIAGNGNPPKATQPDR
jgi:RecB family exonuclease